MVVTPVSCSVVAVVNSAWGYQHRMQKLLMYLAWQPLVVHWLEEEASLQSTVQGHRRARPAEATATYVVC